MFYQVYDGPVIIWCVKITHRPNKGDTITLYGMSGCMGCWEVTSIETRLFQRHPGYPSGTECEIHHIHVKKA